MIRSISAGAVTGLAMLAAGCAQPPLQRAVIVSPEPTGNPASVKRIADDGQGGLILPDGSRVARDARGGFTLPNGDYVSRDASGALNLPNGARCLPDRGGFACP